MRKRVKMQLEELLRSMLKMHRIILQTEDRERRLSYLDECQQAAISVGEAVEETDSSEPAAEKLVAVLENYCEEIFLASQAEEIEGNCAAVWDDMAAEADRLLDELPASYHVVFMPYKAAMWDSLESIWTACSEDERCECAVVLLPYYEYNAAEKSWELRYEGGLFPDDVPVTYYKDYSLETICPDIAYIHNPYDDHNYVTSVDPAYYSHELKKYVKKLVYVPYFVTAGFFSQLDMPAYDHMDYMIIQSENAKEYCLGRNYYDKVIPLGSPKLDKIVQTCRSGVRLPDEWKPALEGKKVLMLNTSINQFLSDGEYLLRKLNHVFDMLEGQDQIALIWRPHPLLEATIKSMRPHLMAEFGKLAARFLECRIGVLDQTQDIERTVALSDGYIGEEASSVINLFEAAGKPVFILDDYITSEYTAAERRLVALSDIAVQGERCFAVPTFFNALLWLGEDRSLHLEGRVEGEPKWYGAYPAVTAAEDALYLSPGVANCPMAFYTESGEWKPLMRGKPETNLFCRKAVPYRDKLFFISGVPGPVMEYNRTAKSWKLHSSCIAELAETDESTDLEITFDCARLDGDLWVTAPYTNRILRLCMDSGEYDLHPVGDDKNGYTGIAADREHLWLAEVHSGDVIRWNPHTGESRVFPMPEGFCIWKYKSGREAAHVFLIDMGKWIVTVPGLSSGMVRIEKSTGEVRLLAEDFWRDSNRAAKGCDPVVYGSACMGKKFDEASVIVQRGSDCAAAIINVEEDTYEMFYPTLSEEDYGRLTEGEDGFEMRQKDYGLFRRESRFFSLRGFMEDLVRGRLEGIKEKQREAIDVMAANADGTCGEKIHQFMMDVLDEDSGNGKPEYGKNMKPRC